MVDHIGVWVADYEKSKTFYTRVLAPLGASMLREYEGHCGFGTRGKPTLWIGSGRASFWGQGCRTGAAPAHIALVAETRAQVDAFYEAARAAGASDFGAPGLRPHYHPNYYGAFVIDPDGNNVEAVCHVPA